VSGRGADPASLSVWRPCGCRLSTTIVCARLWPLSPLCGFSLFYLGLCNPSDWCGMMGILLDCRALLVHVLNMVLRRSTRYKHTRQRMARITRLVGVSLRADFVRICFLMQIVGGPFRVSFVVRRLRALKVRGKPVRLAASRV
jgi:hypothetical protein